jgi:hypothetical protein
MTSLTTETERLVCWIEWEFPGIPHTGLYTELFAIAAESETNADFALAVYQHFRTSYRGIVPDLDSAQINWNWVAQAIELKVGLDLPEQEWEEMDDGRLKHHP